MQASWLPSLQGVQSAVSLGNHALLDACSNAFLRSYANVPQALLDLIPVLLQAGFITRAEELLHWCHQLTPTDQRVLHRLATLWLQTLRQPEALQLYEYLLPSSAYLMALAYQFDLPAAVARQQAERWGHQQSISALLPPVQASQSTLCLGFLSADLCQHPVGLFLWPLVEQLALRPDVALVFYDNGSRHDWLTRHLQAYGLWRKVDQLSDQDIAAQVRADGVSVLIDLSGHTGGNRLSVLCYRPASLQISWLGYWATTGLCDVVDAVLVDPLVVPEHSPEAMSFVEPLVYLPETRWCYRPVPWMPDPTPPPCLERGWVTFGCFNSGSKLNWPLLQCWARLLHAVPDSRLFLKNYQLKDPAFQERLRSCFAHEGIAANRLQLEGPSVHADLLAAYSQVDIALDSFPFNGGLTSCEALWLGLPLVSLVGHNHAGVMAARQGFALLHQLDRREWIAHSEAHYIAIAGALAADPQALLAIRQGQRSRMEASPLCDAPAFALDFLHIIRSLHDGKPAS